MNENIRFMAGVIFVLVGVFFLLKPSEEVREAKVNVYSETFEQLDDFKCPRCGMSFWGIPVGYFSCKCKVENTWLMTRVDSTGATARHMR